MNFIFKSKRGFDAFDDFFIRRKHYPAFLSDGFVTDANGKFAAFAFDYFGFDAECFFDFCRRTDGTRTIRRSDLAKIYAYFFHKITPLFRCLIFPLKLFVIRLLLTAVAEEKPDTEFFAKYVRRRFR